MTTTTQTHYSNGYAAGSAAGSWIIDGNTTEETAARILRGYDDGDPETMDMMPSPLSGEWAGESMTELLGDNYTDADADAYEEGFDHGYWDTVTDAARYILTPQPADTVVGWICVDCLQLTANGETPTEMDETETATWLAQIGDRLDSATLGIAMGTDGCDCFGDEIQHAEGCEEISFSRTQCDGCQSNLGGSRYAVTFTTEEA